MNEKIQPGSRTVYEFFILEEVVKYCIQQCIEVSAMNIHIIYSAVVELARGLDIVHSLRPEDENDIGTFLKKHTHIVGSFKSLSLSQVPKTSCQPLKYVLHISFLL